MFSDGFDQCDHAGLCLCLMKSRMILKCGKTSGQVFACIREMGLEAVTSLSICDGHVADRNAVEAVK